MKPTDVRHFRSAAHFRAWLEKHHATATAQWVAIAKKGATRHVLSHADALDVALAFGWIDGFVSRLDDTHYALRFTPRKPKSNWSAINVRRFAELRAQGLVAAAGLRAFEQRDRAVSEEQRAELNGPYLQALKKNRAAWRFYSAQPPGYRRQASFFVLSARTEATRLRRLEKLIEASTRGERLGPQQPARQAKTAGPPGRKLTSAAPRPARRSAKS